MGDYAFHLEVKDYVDRIQIFAIDGKTLSLSYINDMDEVRSDKPRTKIFNGTIPLQHVGQKMMLKLLGGEGRAYYKASDLFSKPIAPPLRSHRNFVIVNTVEQILHTVIEVPKRLQDVLHLPKLINLIDAEANKVELAPANASTDELLAKGINPETKHFISIVDIRLDEKLKDREADILYILRETHFTICCYTDCIHKEIYIDGR